jgi:4-amino-4-deoxy-L-arabinose transferase-like glycosyltransferase
VQAVQKQTTQVIVEDAKKARKISPWLIVFGMNLALLAHSFIYVVGSFPEFDTLSRLKLWVGILLALGFMGISVKMLRAPLTAKLERWHTAFVALSLALLLALALIPPPPYTYTNFAHVHLLLTVAPSLWALYDALFDGSHVRGTPLRKPRVWLLIGGIVVVVVSVIRVLAFSTYPFIDLQDEAWVTAWTVNWMQTGHFGDPTLGGLGDAYYAYPRFYWLMGIWMNIFGVGLWQGRLLGWLLILPVIGLTVLAARAWYGKAVAALTAAFMFCSAVLISAARIRHDIGLAICVAGALWLYALAEKRGRIWLHFLAGLLIALGIFAHYHAVGMGAALFAGLYIPRYVRQVRARATKRYWLPESGAWLYALGCIVGGVIVLFVQMIPDDLPGWLWTLQHQAKYSANSSQALFAFFGNIFNVGFFSIFEFLLLCVALVAALRRRSERDLSLLIMLLVGHISLAVMGKGAIYYYILPMVPIYALLIGSVFVNAKQAWETPQSTPLPRRQVVIFLLLLMPILGATTGQSLVTVVEGKPLEPVAPVGVQWIRDNISPDQEVVADMYYYFWLRDYHFTSHLVPDFLYPENIERLTTREAVWDAVDMDYLVVDPNLVRSYSLYFKPLLATGLIDRKYTIVAEIPGENGTVTIYRRNPRTG